MLDRKLLRDNADAVVAGAARKGLKVPMAEWQAKYETWRHIKHDLDAKNQESNQVSKSIGALLAQGKKEEAEEAKTTTKVLKETIKVLEEQERLLEGELHHVELSFPNLPHESVPDGKTEAQNVTVRTWGEVPTLGFEPKPHWDIADECKLFDLPRGAKISGSGFVVYTGWGARLQRALVSFMLDVQTLKNGYYEVYPPFLVNSASLVGTGQLPKFGEELYKAAENDLYLIPTAEVPVTNLYRDEILDASQLPMRMAAFSGCFRREAGAAGKDTRGIQRVHQFDKVELVQYCLPENSYDDLEKLVGHAESVLQALGLHYRVQLLCGYEMSAGNAKCYDIEVWSPGMGKYLEISSCSNFESYQARRANIRFRRESNGPVEFVHILNGSGLATPRLFSTLVETNYVPGKGVNVPEALRPYVGTDLIPLA